MNAPLHPKAAIAAAFSAAASTYERSADLQHDVARALARDIAALPMPPSPRILEIGCGTGFLTRALKQYLRPALYVASDIAEPMARRCHSGSQPVVAMDGEAPCFAPAGFDLICSCLAFQWFQDLPASLQRLAALLAPGGHLVFATLGACTFQEWPGASHRYPTLDELRDMAPDGYEAHWRSEWVVRHYASGTEFLARLRDIGANRPPAHYRPLSPGAMRRALRPFETGITVTYEVVTAVISAAR